MARNRRNRARLPGVTGIRKDGAGSACSRALCETDATEVSSLACIFIFWFESDISKHLVLLRTQYEMIVTVVLPSRPFIDKMKLMDESNFARRKVDIGRIMHKLSG